VIALTLYAILPIPPQRDHRPCGVDPAVVEAGRAASV